MSTSIITSFFSSYEIVIGKNVREELDKFVVCKFYLIAHCFHARVQSPTCTTYGKYLLENIMETELFIVNSLLVVRIIWTDFPANFDNCL